MNLICINSNAQNRIGYLVVIEYRGIEIKEYKTEDVNLVNKLFKTHFYQDIDFGESLKNNYFLEHRNEKIIFYVEKKNVIPTMFGVRYKPIKIKKINSISMSMKILRRNNEFRKMPESCMEDVLVINNLRKQGWEYCSKSVYKDAMGIVTEKVEETEVNVSDKKVTKEKRLAKKKR